MPEHPDLDIPNPWEGNFLSLEQMTVQVGQELEIQTPVHRELITPHLDVLTPGQSALAGEVTLLPYIPLLSPPHL